MMFELDNTASNYRNRIEEIHNLILEVASGNFEIKGAVSENMDDIDAIVAGINMLVEELRTSTVSRDYFNSIYKSIVDMVIIFDQQGKITSVNNEVLKVLGYDEAELVGNHFSSILSKGSKNIKSIFKSLSTYKSFQSVEKVFATKDGEKVFVTCSGSILYDNQNRIKGILCIARDISKLKKYENALLKKNKEMDSFVYKASHDLKGPLVSIIGLANVALNEHTDAPASQKYFSLISQTATKLKDTLVTLLKVAVSDNALKEKNKFNISESVGSVLKLLKQKADNSEVQLVNNISTDLEITTNEVLFCTIIQNLVDNAIKYRNSKKQPLIQINTVLWKQGVKITITDNGIGIPQNLQSKVFNMFFRGNQNSEGSGLGLYIVQSHVEKLKGSISFKSIEGVGTSFFIYLPDLK